MLPRDLCNPTWARLCLGALLLASACDNKTPAELQTPLSTSTTDVSIAAPLALVAHAEANAAFVALTPPARRAAAKVAPRVTLDLTLPKTSHLPANQDVWVEGVWLWQGLGSHLAHQETMTLLLAPNISPTTGGPAHGDARLMTIGQVRINGVPQDPTGNSVLMSVALGEVDDQQAITVAVDFRLRIPAVAQPSWGSTQDKGDLENLFALVTGGNDEQHLVGHRHKALHLARFYPMVVPPQIARTRPRAGDAVGWFSPHNLQLNIVVPQGHTVIASGTSQGTEAQGDGAVIWRFQQALTREAGAVIGADLSVTSTQVGATRLVVASQSPHAAVGAEVQRWARRALEEYEQRFGPYPHQSLTIAEAPLPGSLGGLATSGMVAIADLFFDARSATVNPRKDPLLAVITRHPALREGLEFIVAHEIAHQWWGLAVATDRSAAPWIDEGLANHAALDYVDKVHGDKAYRRARELHTRLPFQISRQAGGRDLPVATHLGDFHSLLEYGGIVYGKAGAYFDTASRLISRPAMDQALRGLAAAFDLKQLDGLGLREALAEAAPDPQRIKNLSTRWLDESHGDTDIGAMKIDVLAEYFVGDALLDHGTRELLGALMDNPQVGALVDALMVTGPDGQPKPDLAKTFTIISEALGADDPRLKKWLGLAGRALVEDPSQWGGEAVKALVDSLGPQLGLDPKDQAAIGTVTDLLFKWVASEEGEKQAPVDDDTGKAP